MNLITDLTTQAIVLWLLLPIVLVGWGLALQDAPLTPAQFLRGLFLLLVAASLIIWLAFSLTLKIADDASKSPNVELRGGEAVPLE